MIMTVQCYNHSNTMLRSVDFLFQINTVIFGEKPVADCIK